MEFIVLGLVAAVIAAAAATMAASRRKYRRDNEVVPGVDSGAPAEWAGAHTAEARLHRRLRDSVRALHKVPGIGGTLGDVRRAFEQEALAIDAQLIAVAALPERVRAAPLKRVVVATDALEEAVAELAAQRPSSDEVIAETLDDAIQRQRWLDEARAELDRLDATQTQLPPTPKRVEIIDAGGAVRRTTDPVVDAPVDDAVSEAGQADAKPDGEPGDAAPEAQADARQDGEPGGVAQEGSTG